MRANVQYYNKAFCVKWLYCWLFLNEKELNQCEPKYSSMICEEQLDSRECLCFSHPCNCTVSALLCSIKCFLSAQPRTIICSFNGPNCCCTYRLLSSSSLNHSLRIKSDESLAFVVLSHMLERSALRTLQACNNPIITSAVRAPSRMQRRMPC